MEPDRWFVENLRCPVDRSPLAYEAGALVSTAGRRYPVVDGIPLMLRPDVEQTHWVAEASLRRAAERRATPGSALYLDTLGVTPEIRRAMRSATEGGWTGIDPVVSHILADTGGNAYRHLLGRLSSYPIPAIRLPRANGSRLLDVGCNWGRWSVAAARSGYAVVGIDPSLGAVMAARRVAVELDLPIRYLVGDGRFLPFADASHDRVFCYSVLQHLDREDARAVLREMARVLVPDGASRVQLAHVLGLRSLYQQARRRFRPAREFDVRYRSASRMRRTCEELIGPSSLSADCFFGLGLQWADAGLMRAPIRWLIGASELLRRLSSRVRPLVWLADSLYVDSRRR